MTTTSLFDKQYEKRKEDLLAQVLGRISPMFAAGEVAALRIDPVDGAILSQRSGRGFVNRDILETLLGNLLECVAPGSHNTLDPKYQSSLNQAIGEVADQVYAMIAQSLQAAGEEEDLEERALISTFSLLWDLPELKERALWNRFASLKDPAVWDAYLLHKCKLTAEELEELAFGTHVEKAIQRRDMSAYQAYLDELTCDYVFDYQMQLVTSTYPGWRVLFYHDVAHALTRSGSVADNAQLVRQPVPLLPRAISELGGRYYQADIHPETRIGDANFLDHPHRGLTTGQTGIIGSGCHILPCTLGGLSRRLRRRHPFIGDYVFIGTDADLLGPVKIGDRSIIGPHTQVYGLVELGTDCRIGSSVVIGTVKMGQTKPGSIAIGDGVLVGDGTIRDNRSEVDLTIPARADIPARSYVTNDGCGNPKFISQ